MPRVTDMVRAARSQQEALFALAAALDRIEEALAAKPADEWGTWDDPGTHEQTHKTLSQIAAGPDAIRAAHQSQEAFLRGDDLDDMDPAEREIVLDARRRLANDEGRGIEVNAYEKGRQAEVEQGDDGMTIVLPAADPQRIRGRRQFAEQVLKLDACFKRDDMNEAYAKGGPMWLYLDSEGRDFILTLPTAMKQAMIEDVALDSAEDAHSMGRDIMMARGAEEGSSPEFAVQAQQQGKS